MPFEKNDPLIHKSRSSSKDNDNKEDASDKYISDNALEFDMKGSGRKRDIHLEKIAGELSLEPNPSKKGQNEDEDDLLALMDKAN